MGVEMEGLGGVCEMRCILGVCRVIYFGTMIFDLLPTQDIALKQIQIVWFVFVQYHTVVVWYVNFQGEACDIVHTTTK